MANGSTRYFCSHGCVTPKSKQIKTFMSMASWIRHYADFHPHFHICVVVGNAVPSPIVVVSEEVAEDGTDEDTVSSTSSRVSVLSEEDARNHRTELMDVECSDLVVVKKKL